MSRRSNGGVRIFKDEDYAFLKIIHCLKASGMQIKDIREFISLVMQGDETIEARLELFKKRRSELEKQMADLTETLEALNYKCWYYETAKIWAAPKPLMSCRTRLARGIACSKNATA